jgi:hypothetical protein
VKKHRKTSRHLRPISLTLAARREPSYFSRREILVGVRRGAASGDYHP